MKLTGKEYVSLSSQKDEGVHFTICNLTLYNLLNFFIKQSMSNDLKKNQNIEKIGTESITIEDLNTKKITELSKETKLLVKYQVSLVERVLGIDNIKYDALDKELYVKDFYNRITELFEFYAYELDTVIDNIKLEIKEIEIQ